ncbi:MAG TPA: hypothetical protein PKD86_08995 [Gemmatales bacterium]|nr:hypothetical protein [Gemmatales bacterium]HMP59474.1 hypothetical protein [Gemmatales bacterium]
MNEQTTTIEDIAGKINFRGEYVLLAASEGNGQTVYGGCDLAVQTTRLVANCICEDQLRRDGECLLDEAPPDGSEVPEMEAIIERMRSVDGETFILCYHTEEDGRWRMAWSHDLTATKAYREMIEYVKAGCP